MILVLTAELDGKWTPGARVDNRININDATLAQLLTLPSIGTTRAQAIIDFRNTHKFQNIDELDDVPGIGPATITLLRPLVRI